MTALLVDIGNSRTVIAVGEEMRIVDVRGTPTHARRAVTETRDLLDGYRRRHALDDAVLCSVVPELTPVWQRALKRAKVPTTVVTHRTRMGIHVGYPRPASIGADRLANACAGHAQYGAPLIVADFGTALTFDVVDRSGTYVGGVIAPGLPLMTDYLAERTALLPHVELRGRCGRVGRSTPGAMRIGARVGYRGIVREIVTHLCADASLRGAALCATGGYAGWALKDTDMGFHIEPRLTLQGLARIAVLNQGA